MKPADEPKAAREMRNIPMYRADPAAQIDIMVNGGKVRLMTLDYGDRPTRPLGRIDQQAHFGG